MWLKRFWACYLLTLSILSSEDTTSLRALRERKFKILAHELLIWKLKSRSTWVELGDANTKYFHSLALARRNHNSIGIYKMKRGTG